MPTRAITEEDLLRLPKDGRKHELVDGEIRLSPAGYRHGRIAVRLSRRLDAYAAEKGLGDVVDSSTGFRMPSGNVRSPDVAFVAASRLPQGDAPEGFFDGPPDLAVEILSPQDSARDVLDKVGEYVAAGVRLVWVIDASARRAVAYRSLSDVQHVGEGDELDGQDVLPGFRFALSNLLA